MKTLTTILIVVLIGISNIAFPINFKNSKTENKSNSTTFKKEMFFSMSGDLYIVDATNKKVPPIKININTKYEESSPSLSFDGNTLYFVSDRKGGYGGKDIWASERLSNGNWSKPYNLGKQINTSKDEDDPIILEDGVTLIFTTDGRNINKAVERYSSTMNDEGLWSSPEKAE